MSAQQEFEYKSKFLKTCNLRGFIHQCTADESLDNLLFQAEQKGEPVKAYIGFDCTAPSLHVGSLIQIMIMRHLQQSGHRPIILLGGGTTKIGDPSGKDEARKLIDAETIEKNKAGIKKIFEKYLDLGNGGNQAIIVDNDEWLSDLKYIDVLRDVGRHFSVNRMLSMESVKLRLEREQPLSFLEFNYMILQAYDFVELNQRYDCRLQIGGSDQWGNIVSGVELNRRVKAFENEGDNNNLQEIFGLTTPLLTTSSGAKMGKTADGAVWLDADLLSPYDYWQFWRNIEDTDVIKFFKLFTDLPLDKIEEFKNYEGAKINEAKKILATEVTAMLHGIKAAKSAEDTAVKTFEENKTAASLPEIVLDSSLLVEPIPAFKLFQMSGLADSGGAARRLIRGKGAKINDNIVDDENTQILFSDFTNDGAIKLSSGKKKHVLVKAS